VVFCTVLYALIAYRVESLTKQSFIGRETSEKAFHRWMKIFETFHEGTALVRNRYILGANSSIQRIIGLEEIRSQEEDPMFEQLKFDLKQSIVKPWIKNPKDDKSD
jgi:hypothetical protein